jgi:hypothetical protein
MYWFFSLKCHVCIMSIMQLYHLVMKVPVLCQTKVHTVDFVHYVIPYISDSSYLNSTFKKMVYYETTRRITH